MNHLKTSSENSLKPCSCPLFHLSCPRCQPSQLSSSHIMPASGKILKNKEQAKNRAAGIGDADGRLPSRVKAAEEMLKCTVCFKEIRRTTKNIEAVAHAKGLHPTFTFGQCFVGCPEPAAEAVSSSSSSSSSSSVRYLFTHSPPFFPFLTCALSSLFSVLYSLSRVLR